MIVHSPQQFSVLVESAVRCAVGDCRILSVSAPEHSNGWIVVAFEARGVRCLIDRDRMELALRVEDAAKRIFRPRKSLFDSDYSVETALEDLVAQLVEALPKNAEPVRRYSTTTPAVTCRACARPAPAGVVADLGRSAK